MKMAAFTALNGTSPKVTESTNGNMDASRPSSPERPKNQGSATSETRAAGEVSTSQRERETWAGPSHERQPYPSASYPDVEGSHKRKRSESDEPSRDHPLSPPERSDRHRLPSESREIHGTPLSQRDYRPYGDEFRDQKESWYSQRTREEQHAVSYERQHSGGPHSARSDDQLGESTQRITGSDYGNTSPGAEERSVSVYSGQYPEQQRRDGVIQQSDQKKRKRNFSNRTKTGCLTCRKRKKKCDEGKPECSNCIRGGFVCAGYPPQRGAWTKPETKPTTIQIESKDPSYVPPGAYGMPQQSSSYSGQPVHIGQQQKREPLPSYRGQPLRIDPPQGRPLQSDDDRATASTIPSASITSPDNKLSALSAYTNAANVFPTPVSAAPLTAFSDRTPKEYQRVPPIHDLTRAEPEQGQQNENSLPRISVLNPTRTNSPSSQHGGLHPTSGVQATAQLALSHAQFPSNRPRREKEEMLNGRQYYPFDKELVLERERCNAACWRFNNSTNPNLGVSPAERARLFRDILAPPHGIQISPTATSPATHTGRVGENATVEAPFNCDYGYNIQIGDNVSIGRNCLINDVCKVKIGNNVLISPNVCIYTGTTTTNPHRRYGNRGTQYGKPVTIQEDVWIGANVVILPGVTIGRGVTVGAGSVVTKDLQPFTIYYSRAEAEEVRQIAR
ncbi:hypothetical protein VTK73DRAFT_3961 [Phialemonium thermophilum]|uniref:Zn(2)-C6 fungal-type domain-containing protein n=1 Tax=Phialemonium thermophilum TaxID=223376 RepID=A0ABR3Y0Q3_9PEZI